MIPLLEDILAHPCTTQIAGHPRPVYAFLRSHNPLLYKIPFQQETPSITDIATQAKRRFISYLDNHVPVRAVLTRIDNDPTHTEEEMNAIWSDAEIPTPQLHARQGHTLVYEYITGTTLAKALTTPQAESHFAAYINLTHYMRERARIDNDVRYLHPDGHLNNYLVNTQGSIIAIDPGAKLKPEATIPQVEASMHFHTLRALYEHEETRHFMETYANHLTKQEKRYLQASIQRIPRTMRYALSLVRELGKKGFIKEYHLPKHTEQGFLNTTQALMN